MIEYDDRVQMWFASYVDTFGKLHRRWFETREAAEHWLAHKRQ